MDARQMMAQMVGGMAVAAEVRRVRTSMDAVGWRFAADSGSADFGPADFPPEDFDAELKLAATAGVPRHGR